mmetsp:Transcript_13257/g.39579  ORF Transcript_13257/g.39579 Transcript_13257/m.39579 type:complete len:223 (-) Transcript_13257:566-1234(-)
MISSSSMLVAYTSRSLSPSTSATAADVGSSIDAITCSWNSGFEPPPFSYQLTRPALRPTATTSTSLSPLKSSASTNCAYDKESSMSRWSNDSAPSLANHKTSPVCHAAATTSTSASPSTSAACIPCAPPSEDPIKCVVNDCDPSLAYHATASCVAAFNTSISASPSRSNAKTALPQFAPPPSEPTKRHMKNPSTFSYQFTSPPLFFSPIMTSRSSSPSTSIA